MSRSPPSSEVLQAPARSHDAPQMVGQPGATPAPAQRIYGDGSELDGFDDLPVNREKERQFVRAPKKRNTTGVSRASDPTPSVNAAFPRKDPIETGRRVASDGSLYGKRKATVTGPLPSSSTARPSLLQTKSRPSLQLIRNLSGPAAGTGSEGKGRFDHGGREDATVWLSVNLTCLFSQHTGRCSGTL